jgi:membrane fusion protein, multidrug efflux system
MNEKKSFESDVKSSVVEVEPPPQTQISPTQPPADARRGRSRSVRVLIWVLVLAGFAVVLWFLIHHKQPVKAQAGRAARFASEGAVTVTTVSASKGDIGVYLQSIGTVTPVYTDTVTSQASGQLIKVNYREGQLAQKGQVLLQIDPRPYEATVEAEEGTLEHDQGLLAQAKSDLTRYKDAWTHNAIAQQILTDQEALVQQDEGQVKADEGNLALDKVNLSYCTIRAPISGRVGLRLVDPGNVVSATSATPLVVITQLQPITVVFTIPQEDVAEVEMQMHVRPLQVTVYNQSGQTELASGTLSSTSNQINTTTGTLELRASFNNKNNALFPNEFVNARLLVKTLRGVTRIPSSAIQYNGPSAYVFLINNGIAHMHTVKPGETDGDLTEVTGIRPGDIAADSSFEKLEDASKVTILGQANSQAAAAGVAGSGRGASSSAAPDGGENRNSHTGNAN